MSNENTKLIASFPVNRELVRKNLQKIAGFFLLYTVGFVASLYFLSGFFMFLFGLIFLILMTKRMLKFRRIWRWWGKDSRVEITNQVVRYIQSGKIEEFSYIELTDFYPNSIYFECKDNKEKGVMHEKMIFDEKVRKEVISYINREYLRIQLPINMKKLKEGELINFRNFLLSNQGIHLLSYLIPNEKPHFNTKTEEATLLRWEEVQDIRVTQDEKNWIIQTKNNKLYAVPVPVYNLALATALLTVKLKKYTELGEQEQEI